MPARHDGGVVVSLVEDPLRLVVALVVRIGFVDVRVNVFPLHDTLDVAVVRVAELIERALGRGPIAVRALHDAVPLLRKALLLLPRPASGQSNPLVRGAPPGAWWSR